MEDVMTEKDKRCEGECPRCGSIDLDYGNAEQDEGIEYSLKCNECGCKFREQYSIVYDRTVWTEN